jgi:phospho-N-acetylmuramoyl-pentapeptide-transferase
MLYFLSDYQSLFGPLRLFEYVTFRAGGAAFTAMLICFILGPLTVRLLKKFRTAAPARLEGLVDEKFIDREKDKTPSMGGLLIVASITVSTLLWASLSNPLVIVFLSTLLSLSALGFMDDYSKILKKGGISGKTKLLFQFAIALLAVYFLDSSLTVNKNLVHQLMVPFYKAPVIVGMPAIVAYLFASVVVVGSSNAVNLTDGKDGLAVGCAISCALAYAMFAYL